MSTNCSKSSRLLPSRLRLPDKTPLRELWYELVISGSLGLRVVRFTKDEVNYRLGSVYTQIQAILLRPEQAPLHRRSLPEGWGAVPQGLRGRAVEGTEGLRGGGSDLEAKYCPQTTNGNCWVACDISRLADELNIRRQSNAVI